MTPYEAATRIGLHETAVRTVDERPAEGRESDFVATLRDGTRWLISDTVARPYVAEVDDIDEEAEDAETADDAADDAADDDSSAEADKPAPAKPAAPKPARPQGKRR